MQITSETMDLINDLKEWGDGTKIAKLANTSNVNVHLALKQGRGSEHLVSSIISFYESVKDERLAIRKRINQISK